MRCKTPFLLLAALLLLSSTAADPTASEDSSDDAFKDRSSEAISAVVSATATLGTTTTPISAATSTTSTLPIVSQTLQPAMATYRRYMALVQVPRFFQQLWTWQPTFMQGFLLGQFSMLILLAMAIKYILFEEPIGRRSGIDDDGTPTLSSAAVPGASAEAIDGKGRTVVQEGGFGLSKFMIFTRKPKEPQPDDLAEELARMHKEILSRTGYDLMAHRSESCDWLTVFLAQIIAKFRADAERHDRLVRVISEALNGELRPSVIDNLRITQFSLGSDFLRITAARIVPSTGSLGMRAELDLALQDEITLGFNTRVMVNWPRPSVAALPVSMVVSLVKFVGTVAIQFDCASPEPSVTVTILPDYVLEFDIQTLIGSKAKVQNLPMLTSVISRKLQAAFAKELVMPNEKCIKIKHPFTPKPTGPPATTSAPAAAAAASPNQTSNVNGPAAPSLGGNTAANAQRSPTVEANRPSSPLGPIAAELPPDYNTQLPPPHPLRSNVHSRAAATASAMATGNINTSPTMGVPARMYTPEEPMQMSGSSMRSSMGIPPIPQQPQQSMMQRGWSPDSSVYGGGISPQIRPIVGMSSSTMLGPSIFPASRIITAGSRSVGNYAPYLQPPGLNSVLMGTSNAPGRLDSRMSVPARQQDIDTDDMQVKDSVRQRVNRVIRTVNES
ncbi:ERMES complex subunit mmm1 [Coemansia sp. Benny D115]|nr:ERMES complex subunit mmm1 [Coemansia sp. Benny D115]